MIIAEAVFVLASKRHYARSRVDIQQRLEPLVATPGLRLERKRLLIRALQIYAETNIDFEDAIIVAHIESDDDPTVISFDRNFDRIPGVTRVEP